MVAGGHLGILPDDAVVEGGTSGDMPPDERVGHPRTGCDTGPRENDASGDLSVDARSVADDAPLDARVLGDVGAGVDRVGSVGVVEVGLEIGVLFGHDKATS